MIEKSIESLCVGDCNIRKIVLHTGTPDPQKYVCKIGERSFDRFFYVTKGCFHIRNNNGDELTANAGMILYLPTDVEYESYWDEDVEGGYISFNFVLNDSEGKHLKLSDNVELVANDKNGEIYKLFSSSLAAYIHYEKFIEIILQSYFYRIIYAIVKQHERNKMKQRSDSRIIYKAMVYLNDNYMNEISTEQLAEMCGVSVATFRRAFKKHNNVSPLKYKNHLKMLHAEEMLQSGFYTVSEVSDIINCTDASHFNRLYYKEFGISPSKSIPKID